MKQKNLNVELIRLISFLMVIVIHVTNYFCRAYGQISFYEYIFVFSLNSISRISIPCFFMISGYLLVGREESVSKILKRVVRFSFVLLFWTFVYYIFNNYYTHQSWDLNELFKTPAEAHLWFLDTIIPLYIMLFIYQKIFKTIPRVLGITIAVIVGLIVSCAYIYQLDFRLQYFYFFILGHIIAQNINHIKIKQKQLLVIFILCNVLNIIYGINKTIRLDRYVAFVTQYRNPFIWLSAVCFFILIMRFQNGNVNLSERFTKIVQLCCSCSFGVYLIHIIFLDIYKQNFAATNFSVYIVTPILTVIITVLSVGSIYLIRRTTLGRHIT